MPSLEQALRNLFNPASAEPDRANHTAVIQAGGGPEGSDKTITYAEFEKLVIAAVAEFKKLSVTKQDRVLLTAGNCAELSAAIVAIWRLGGVAVPVDFRLTEKEVENVANQLQVKVLCASSRYNPNLSSSYANAKAVKFDLAQ